MFSVSMPLINTYPKTVFFPPFSLPLLFLYHYFYYFFPYILPPPSRVLPIFCSLSLIPLLPFTVISYFSSFLTINFPSSPTFFPCVILLSFFRYLHRFPNLPFHVFSPQVLTPSDDLQIITIYMPGTRSLRCLLCRALASPCCLYAESSPDFGRPTDEIFLRILIYDTLAWKVCHQGVGENGLAGPI